MNQRERRFSLHICGFSPTILRSNVTVVSDKKTEIILILVLLTAPYLLTGVCGRECHHGVSRVAIPTTLPITSTPE